MESGKERVFLDLNEKEGKSDGLFVRNDLVKTIQEIEATGDKKVIGIVYNDTYTIELITKDIKL
jgi:hypothetical protein|tara:strand:+ start:103 stop:294 length:192 start_codon:yes stop_codon:yes gene_type:complete